MADMTPIVGGSREAWHEEGLPRRTMPGNARSSRRQLQTRALDLNQDQQFVCIRWFVSILSYALLLSDVTRSGIGIRRLGPEYPPLHPDVFVSYGPYAYPIIHLTTQNATSDATSDFWPYKYDTTSLSMRSVAQHLRLTAWPPCILYKEHCDEPLGLPLSTLLTMIDSVVDAVATHPINQPRSPRPGSPRFHKRLLTLRTESEYKDRLHHYALPWFFERSTKRTTQAIHYTHQRSADQDVTGRSSRHICGNVHPRPLSCDELWTKHAFGVCGRFPNPPCENTIWTDIPNRLDTLLDAYPNHTVDFIVLDSMEDYTRGSLGFQGRKYFDLVMLARVRQCNPQAPEVCTTIAVDDYRYESASFTMNAPSWFPLVASLRAIGQVYMWLRMMMLFGGCVAVYTARSSGKARVACLAASVRTLFLIPSQVVVYGSSTPMLFYAVAHLIDSPAVYELVTTHFDTFLGELSFSASDFVRQCSVSMRTVWILGLVCHVGLVISTHSSWSPTHGMLGIPDYSISVVAAFTILAQYRSLKFRSTRVFSTFEVASSSRRAQHLSNSYDRTHGAFNNLFAGSPIDLQCLSCVLLALGTIVACSWLLNRFLPRLCPFRIVAFTRTLVPYSAGHVWPHHNLVVSWFGPTFMRTKPRKQCPALTRAFKPHKPRRTSLRDALYTTLRRTRRLSSELQEAPVSALAMNDSNVSTRLQSDMHSLDNRSREVESLLVLVNLAVMTDPLTFLRLRVFSSHRVGIYESQKTRRRFLLPLELRTSDADIPLDWTEFSLIAVVTSRDLDWRDLLRCG